MTKRTGKNTNQNTEAVTATISVGSTTAVTLLAALASTDLPHSQVTITNNGNKSLWVRNYPAADDNLKRGERVAPGANLPIIRNSEVYIGEISAIFQSGSAKDVFVVSF